MSDEPDDHEVDPYHGVAEMTEAELTAARIDATPEWQGAFAEVDRLDPAMLEKLAREAKARADAATKGPWLHYKSTRWDDHRACGYDSRSHHRGAPYYCTGPRVDSDTQASTDAAFIAHARADVPVLSDAVLRLLRENSRLKAKLRFMAMAEAAGPLPTSALASGESPVYPDDEPSVGDVDGHGRR